MLREFQHRILQAVWMAGVCAICAVVSHGAEPVRNVVVIVDDSGSMNETLSSDFRMTRMQAAQQALLTVLQSLSNDTHVGVLALNTRRPRDGAMAHSTWSDQAIGSTADRHRSAS